MKGSISIIQALAFHKNIKKQEKSFRNGMYHIYLQEFWKQSLSLNAIIFLNRLQLVPERWFSNEFYWMNKSFMKCTIWEFLKI